MVSMNKSYFYPIDYDYNLEPTKSHGLDAGYDLHAAADFTIDPGDIVEVRTGYCVNLVPGTMGKVDDRSSLARRGITTLGGVIDCGYDGEIIVILKNLGNESIHYFYGDRIAQLIIYRIECDEDASSDRGTGGFGSTGR